MIRLKKLFGTFVILVFSLTLASYAAIISGELLDDYYYGKTKVLVDASRDGGTHWSPQPFEEGVFDPNLPHQGKALADYLRSQGMEVVELPRPYTITPELLSDFDLVIRANAFPRSAYSPDEIDAYQQFVDEGGRLILLAEFSDPGDPDLLALSFGLELEGFVTGSVDSFADHPITSGVKPFTYSAGSVLVEDLPDGATELGFIGGETAMGLLTYGYGQLFFIGDTAAINRVEQPLIDNLLIYFLTAEGLAAQIMQADLSPQAEGPLLNKLDAALVSLDKEQFGSYVNKLNAFINQVEALERSGRIDAATAESLIGSAMTLIVGVRGS